MTQTPAPDDALLARLRAYVDAPGGDPVVARDPVNQPMIRHWCDALGDRNPAYSDQAAAAGTRHGGVIAPPAMLQTWCMDRPRDAASVVTAVLAVLGEHGYTSVVATGYEQEYERPLRLGDQLTEQRAVEHVSERKRTALGEGYFVTFRSTYRDTAGAVVGTSKMTVLRFRPPATAEPARAQPATAEPATAQPATAQPATAQPATAEPAAGRRPRPVVNRDTAFFWDGVARGELLAQRCAGCATLRHPPAPMCGQCGSTEWDAVPLSGRGAVHSWVVHHHPPLPGFELPVTVVLADLAEGVRFVAELAGDEVYAGMPVELELAAVDDELTLPRFRATPAGAVAS